MTTTVDDLNPEGRRAFIALICTIIISFIAVATRIACKLSPGSQAFLGWDDAWMIVALCLIFASEGVLFWGIIRSDGGESVPDLLAEGNFDGASDYLLSIDIDTILWYGIIAFICFSILALYKRLFSIRKSLNKAIWVLSGIVTAWAISGGLASILLCIPPSNFWKMVDLEKCGNYNVLTLCMGIFEILFETAILAIPVKPTIDLKLERQKKVVILGIFLLGSFVVISGIIRAAVIYIPGSTTGDSQQQVLWNRIHIIAAVVSANLPVYKPLWTQVTVASKSTMSYLQSLVSTRSSSRVDESGYALESRSDGRYGSSVNSAHQGSQAGQWTTKIGTPSLGSVDSKRYGTDTRV